jgi:hypothetical protein
MGRFRALALVAVAGTAAAQPQPSQKQQAGALVKQAIAKSQSGDHATAIELYLQAYALIPQPLLLSNIGSEYQSVPGKQVEALKYFCKYLEADPTGSNVSYATAQAKVLQQQLGTTVDDKDVCKPAKPEPPPPPPDNAGSGTSTVAPTVEPPPPPSRPHEDSGRTLQWVGMGVGGAGALGLAVGIYYGIQARSVSDEITNHKITDPWPANIKQIESDGHNDQKLQIGFLITGGVALVGGAVLYFVGRSQSAADEHVSIAPVVTPTSVGLSLGGSY